MRPRAPAELLGTPGVLAGLPAALGAAGRRYLSMSPTTKNIDPRIATMSATSVPGSSSTRAWMLLYDAERSFSRYGVFSPLLTR